MLLTRARAQSPVTATGPRIPLITTRVAAIARRVRWRDGLTGAIGATGGGTVAMGAAGGRADVGGAAGGGAEAAVGGGPGGAEGGVAAAASGTADAAAGGGATAEAATAGGAAARTGSGIVGGSAAAAGGAATAGGTGCAGSAGSSPVVRPRHRRRRWYRVGPWAPTRWAQPGWAPTRWAPPTPAAGPLPGRSTRSARSVAPAAPVAADEVVGVLLGAWVPLASPRWAEVRRTRWRLLGALPLAGGVSAGAGPPAGSASPVAAACGSFPPDSVTSSRPSSWPSRLDVVARSIRQV